MNAMVAARRQAKIDARAIHDVGGCIKSWGRRGILSGAIFGFALAAVLVAIPLTTDTLTFGTIGTLIVGTIECAVIAGGFGVMAAALYGQGVLRHSTAGLERELVTGRKHAEDNWREGDVPLAGWPARWAFPSALPDGPSLACNYADARESAAQDLPAMVAQSYGNDGRVFASEAPQDSAMNLNIIT